MVTSDRMERQMVEGAGALSISAEALGVEVRPPERIGGFGTAA